MVLFAGSAHTRAASGVEAHLLRQGYDPGQVLSVGLIEHASGARWPPRDVDPGAYDVIVRTPHSGEQSACARLRDLGLAPPLEEG